MKHYVRDWKHIIIARCEGDKKRKYEFDAQIDLGVKGGYYGCIVNKKAIFYVGWAAWYVRKGLPVVTDSEGNKMINPEMREIAKSCILEYERMMEAEKATSPCYARTMTDEERQEAMAKAAEREAREYHNYSVSNEYQSGVPYHFYKAKTKVLCAKDSIKVPKYIRRTYFADTTVQDMYKKYRGTCMNCVDRATCNAVCSKFDSEDRVYLMNYITNMVDSEEVQEFENLILINRRGA